MNRDNVGKRWTYEEEMQATTLWLNRGATVEDIANALGRDFGGVAGRLKKLGLIGDAVKYDLRTTDTAESVAKQQADSVNQARAFFSISQTKSVGDMSKTSSVIINTLDGLSQGQTMQDQINWAINLEFGGYFTETSRGWYKTYDKLDNGWLAIGAVPPHSDRLAVVKVLRQTKECPRDMKTERFDFLLPKNQDQPVEFLCQREELTAETIRTTIEKTESKKEDDSIREALGAEKMDFIKQMMKTPNAIDNIKDIAAAHAKMGGEVQASENLEGLAASVEEAQDLIHKIMGAGEDDDADDNTDSGSIGK